VIRYAGRVRDMTELPETTELRRIVPLAKTQRDGRPVDSTPSASSLLHRTGLPHLAATRTRRSVTEGAGSSHDRSCGSGSPTILLTPLPPGLPPLPLPLSQGEAHDSAVGHRGSNTRVAQRSATRTPLPGEQVHPGTPAGPVHPLPGPIACPLARSLADPTLLGASPDSTGARSWR